MPGSHPVAILPFREARLTPVRDHRHFALLARSSWQATVYPNHVLPALAPELAVYAVGSGLAIDGALVEAHVMAALPDGQGAVALDALVVLRA